MEVYFIALNKIGQHILHKFGCSQLYLRTGEIFGLFSHPLAALNEVQDEYLDTVLCKECCAEELSGT